MSGHEEIVLTIEQLRREFEDLGVRGLRAAGAQRVAKLALIREEFQRIGAEHLAEQIGALIAAIQNDDRGAAAALLRAQTSLRLFERVLTLEVAAAKLQTLVGEDQTRERVSPRVEPGLGETGPCEESGHG
ncbi:MAG: hypothetical protein MUF25_08120 [Pirellulaceae bacterium]|jgi:hypothetical protein|nr:hypothetical protein [Pirellulaceae bacterium]